MERNRIKLALGACAIATGLPLSAADGQPARLQQASLEVAPDQSGKARLPTWMRPLTPAEIDETLAIGGEDIAARKVRSRMTVAVRINGQGPYRFVVDSGADSSVLGANVARSLRLPAGNPAVLNSMTESTVVERALVDELSVGPTSVNGLLMPVLKERHIGGDGMLGLDALAHQRLMMDFEKRTISVDDATKRAAFMEGEIVVTARLKRGQLILTQVSAQKLAVSAVVDTGSEVTVGNLALRDKLIKKRGTKVTTTEIIGVTGTPATIEIATIPELRLGTIVLRNVPMAFADLPPFKVFGLDQQPALLLGTDLMSNFRRLSLDFRERRVRFQLRRCDISPIQFGQQASLIASSDAACAR